MWATSDATMKSSSAVSTASTHVNPFVTPGRSTTVLPPEVSSAHTSPFRTSARQAHLVPVERISAPDASVFPVLTLEHFPRPAGSSNALYAEHDPYGARRSAEQVRRSSTPGHPRTPREEQRPEDDGEPPERAITLEREPLLDQRVHRVRLPGARAVSESGSPSPCLTSRTCWTDHDAREPCSPDSHHLVR